MLLKRVLQLLLCSLIPTIIWAQVTSSNLSGTVLSVDKKPIEGARVTAIHEPSGTRYSAITGTDGHYSIPNVRVGGPYLVKIEYSGLPTFESTDVFASLGMTANVDAILNPNQSNKLDEVIVTTSNRNNIISSQKTGANVVLGRENINRTPTIGRTINDITKYNAYSNGSSFGGQDPRLNNVTIDGSVFNNGFGLGSSAIAGGRTGSSAISLDALDQLQINIAPFDIRQSGFAGAGINAVTRSGTNSFNGSAYYMWNNRGLTGKKADSDTTNISQTPFSGKTYGFRLGGPIIKNKLFFFANAEFVRNTQPALSYVANGSGSNGNPSRTTAADLQDLSSYLKTNFNYDLGSIDNFNSTVKSNKILARFDYNINDIHKLTFRYSYHNSQSESLISNSSSSNTAGNGNRQNLATALSGQNTGYIQNDNTRSYVLELNSNFRGGFSNQFLATYNKQIENRGYRTDVFPTIDILKDGSTYTSIGMDPFTPNNKLDYKTINVTDNLSYSFGNHNLTLGASFESFKSNNLFFYASNGVWVFNSIADFKTAANAYLANPDLTTSPVSIARFNYRYTLLPNGQLPWQIFKTRTLSAYLQDEYKIAKNFRITGGLRLDYIWVPNTAKDYGNPIVQALNFYAPGSTTPFEVNTGLMPKSRMYFSPRVGFNWDVNGDRKTQIRGGSGIFLSRIPYVLLSNQLGNNGVNIGLINATGDQALNYPFTLDPSKYTPTSTDLSKITGYNVNATDRNFKFPQVWKTDLAVDQVLPWGGLVATIEGLYNKNIHAMYYFDANLKNANGTFSGDDNRPTYPALGLSGTAANTARYTNSQINGAYILSNTNKGYSYSITGKIEKPLVKAWGGMVGYTYSKSKDLFASGLSTVNVNTPGVNGINYLDESYSDNDLRHRFVGTASYRITYGGDFGGSTTFTLGVVSASGSKISYTASNDMNGDGQINDLIYIPKSGSNLNFVTLTTGNLTFTPEQQQEAFNKFVDGNKYLSSRRGQYVERNGLAYPWLTRMDFSIEQDVFVKVGKDHKPNILRFRMDIINFGNMLNNKWGVGNTPTTYVPLTYVGKNTGGEPTYRLATQVINGSTQLLQDAFVKSRTISDVYQIQLGVRYIFGN